MKLTTLNVFTKILSIFYKGETFINSIKTRFMLLLGTIMVLVCIGLGLIAYYTSVNALSTVAGELLTYMVTESSRVAQATIEDQFSVMLSLANTEIISDPNVSMQEKLSYMANEAKRNNFNQLAIGDKSGATLKIDGTNIVLKESVYYQESLKGNPGVSDLLVNKADKTTSLIYCVPIKDKSGNVSNVLIGTRNGNELNSITNSIKLGNTGKAYMINKSGTTVAYSDPEIVIKQTNAIEQAKTDPTMVTLAAIQKRMTVGETGYGLYTYGRVNKYVAFAPVKGTLWSLGH